LFFEALQTDSIGFQIEMKFRLKFQIRNRTLSTKVWSHFITGSIDIWRDDSKRSTSPQKKNLKMEKSRAGATDAFNSPPVTKHSNKHCELNGVPSGNKTSGKKYCNQSGTLQ